MNKKQLMGIWVGMDVAILLRTIGLLYFLIVVLSFSKNLIIDEKVLHRLIVCFNFAFFGLGIRAFLYHGIYKKGEKETLYIKGIINHIASHLFYGFMALAVVSFIFLAWYDNFIKMDITPFNVISGFIFSYCGFTASAVGKHFFGEDKNKTQKE